ncbi:hypothetical protein LMG24238_06715 [Paraburkholderia sediminicola]|uniref:Solute-binding protein family 3/N-terminal domain-containing protein n=1 Tax=Paraburkholderia sediminicola TaxID=458836 RepID=A0A6J5CMP6_9BURK|nr:transporter substrate-binding domain-containing protein [Paraburkholderia sediminicola]CAB3741100.1 hypothetical protein LMG24238_06715 [Paraburkholderia sediminicola]
MNINPALVEEIAPTGRLRASINLASTVLAFSYTDSAKLAGVTIDLSREFARRLGVSAEFREWGNPGDAFQALVEQQADVAFLAVDSKRAEKVQFTAPYVQIEAGYLALEDSEFHRITDVDREGVEVLVIETSAYDLYLSRALQHASVRRFPTGEEAFSALLQDRPGRKILAGVKQALSQDMKREGGLHMLPGSFMAINQAVALPRDCSCEARELIEGILSDLVNSGFIAESLAKHGIEGVGVVAAGAIPYEAVSTPQ